MLRESEECDYKPFRDALDLIGVTDAEFGVYPARDHDTFGDIEAKVGGGSNDVECPAEGWKRTI